MVYLYFFFFFFFSALRRCQYLECFLIEDGVLFMQHSQYHCCWWLGDTRSQVFNRSGFDYWPCCLVIFQRQKVDVIYWSWYLCILTLNTSCTYWIFFFFSNLQPSSCKSVTSVSLIIMVADYLGTERSRVSAVYLTADDLDPYVPRMLMSC